MAPARTRLCGASAGEGYDAVQQPRGTGTSTHSNTGTQHGRFRCPTSAQRFLCAFARVANLFRLRRHLVSAPEYRLTLQERFATWREVASLATI
jgi:putative transposase